MKSSETIQVAAQIDYALALATITAHGSRLSSPNSHRAGYDEGLRDGLKRALRLLMRASEDDI